MKDDSRKSYQESLDRLKDIVKEVQNKDLELEESLDLLEEGVRLANQCIGRVDVPETLDNVEQNIETEEQDRKKDVKEEEDNETGLS